VLTTLGLLCASWLLADARGIAAGEPPDAETPPARANPGVFLGLGWRTGALAAGATKCPPPIIDGTRGRGDDWPIPALGATRVTRRRQMRYASHTAYQLLASLYAANYDEFTDEGAGACLRSVETVGGKHTSLVADFGPPLDRRAFVKMGQASLEEVSRMIEHAKALDDAGAPAPRLLLAAALDFWGNVTRYALVFELLEEHVELRSLGIVRPRHVSAAARALAAFRRAGFEHRDIHGRNFMWSESTQSVSIVDIDAVVRVNATGHALHDPGSNALEDDDEVGVGEGNCASLCNPRCCPGVQALEDHEDSWNECVAALEREGRTWNLSKSPPERHSDPWGLLLARAIDDLLRLCHPAVADVHATDETTRRETARDERRRRRRRRDDDDSRGRDELR